MLMHPGLTLTLTHPGLHMVAFDLSFGFVLVSSKSMHNYRVISLIEMRQQYQKILVRYTGVQHCSLTLYWAQSKLQNIH